jgi:hypothetical protein
MGRRASDAARGWFAQTVTRTISICTVSRSRWPRPSPNIIRGELGFTAEEARDPEAMLAQGYRGSRYSFGYLACPNLADQKQLLALLGAEEIGIALSEEDQLDPEQPTSAIVVHHRRRNISRSDVARRQRNFLLCATQFIPVAGLTRGPRLRTDEIRRGCAGQARARGGGDMIGGIRRVEAGEARRPGL